jgi:hypothetical protein
MKKTKFIAKVNRGGTRATEYVQRMDRAPIRMTTDRKLLCLWDDSPPKTLSDSIHNSQRSPELVPVG